MKLPINTAQFPFLLDSIHSVPLVYPISFLFVCLYRFVVPKSFFSKSTKIIRRYTCMYLCMCVCVCVCVYTHTHTHTQSP